MGLGGVDFHFILRTAWHAGKSAGRQRGVRYARRNTGRRQGRDLRRRGPAASQECRDCDIRISRRKGISPQSASLWAFTVRRRVSFSSPGQLRPPGGGHRLPGIQEPVYKAGDGCGYRESARPFVRETNLGYSLTLSKSLSSFFILSSCRDSAPLSFSASGAVSP